MTLKFKLAFASNVLEKKNYNRRIREKHYRRIFHIISSFVFLPATFSVPSFQN